MISLLAKLLADSLKKQLTPKRIDSVFSGFPTAASPKATEDICVCALQLELKTRPSVACWLRDLDAMLAQAVGQGAQLVCLPEFYGLTPLLCHRLVQQAGKLLPLMPEGENTGGAPVSLTQLLAPFDFLPAAYEDILCRFARRYGIYIYGGTGFVLEKEQVFNRGFLVTPQGNVAARQDKIHLTEEEMAMGLSAGDTLQMISTEIGNIALSVCMDATYFETFRVAKRLGADYIIVPIGDMAEFDAFLALRGAQMRVNETGLTAIKPALVSATDFPVTFSGKAGIYFPLSTGLPSGEVPEPHGEGMVIRKFPLAQLRNANSDLFLRRNPDFDRNYCAELIKQSIPSASTPPEKERQL